MLIFFFIIYKINQVYSHEFNLRDAGFGGRVDATDYFVKKKNLSITFVNRAILKNK